MRRVWFTRGAKSIATETAFYDRDSLPPDADIEGPAVVFQMDSTTLVPPEWRARVDEFGNLVLERSRSRPLDPG